MKFPPFGFLLWVWGIPTLFLFSLGETERKTWKLCDRVRADTDVRERPLGVGDIYAHPKGTEALYP